MYKHGVKDVSFVACNTDSKELSHLNIPLKIQLGDLGLGVGGKPEKGKEEAEKSVDKVKKLFEDDTKMVFITAGMGGGTGTGAAPLIAGIAKESGLLTVGIVTIPFYFEKRKRIVKALKGVEEMKKNVDALLVINNERLRDMYTDGITTAEEAFAKADEVLSVATKGIAELITKPGIIGCDFCDVQTVMKDGGYAMISMGQAGGEHRLQKAILKAIESPLLSEKNIEEAKNILYIVYSSKDHPMLIDELKDLDVFTEELDRDVELIWGLYNDDTLGEDVKITIVATGFGEEKAPEKVPADNYDDLIDKYYSQVKKEASAVAEVVSPTENEPPVDSGEQPVDPDEPVEVKESILERIKRRILEGLMDE